MIQLEEKLKKGVEFQKKLWKLW